MTDTELIHRVRDDNDSSALRELTTRHTGIYVSIAQKYAGINDKIQMQDLKEDLPYNIYNWVLKYNPEKKMKFGTYVGEMTRYLCLDLLNQTPENVEMTELNAPVARDNTSAAASSKDTLEQIKARIDKIEDKRFWTIFEARHFSEPTQTWRDIAERLGLTHEGARQIYLKHIARVKRHLST